MIAIVVAADENNIIGKDNQLPWHLPADLRHFKNLTMGHPVLMGRKTFESIGKPLPGRTSIVITRQSDYKAAGCMVAHSLEEAVQLAKQQDETVCIIGGAEIFKQALAVADTIYFTRIHHIFDGDTFFPEISGQVWEQVSAERHEPDEKNQYSYTYQEFRRRATGVA